MGFDTIVAWVGAVMVIMIAFASLMSLYDAHLDSMQGFYEYEKEVGERHRTGMDIVYADYAAGSLELHVNNTGRNRIPFENDVGDGCFDVFVDREWNGHANFSIDIMNKTISALLWDPDEVVNITVNLTIGAGDHIVSVVDCGGVSDSEEFTV